jgi:2-keto-3-deoxy-L-rhamnonate aldolase RhmA
MQHTGLKAMIKTPDLKLGNFIVEFATPGIGHILKAGGCDFAFFDMEHSGFSFETLKSAIRYFEAASIAVIVRVPAQENDMLPRKRRLWSTLSNISRKASAV